MSDNPLVSCLCVTYGRPILLGEAVKCFIDQSYENKELIVLNDQEGVTLKLENCPDNIKIVNYPTRFDSLGEKRNYISDMAKGEYLCIWDDDDLYTPWRIRDSVELIKNSHADIVKSQHAFMSVHNKDYMVTSNLYHSQAIVKKEYFELNKYPLKSVGEDAEFERNAKVISINTTPLFWYVYRWGMNIHHLSGIADEKESWDKSLSFEPYTNIYGEVMINPEFKEDYWGEIEKYWANVDKKYSKEWHNNL